MICRSARVAIALVAPFLLLGCRESAHPEDVLAALVPHVEKAFDEQTGAPTGVFIPDSLALKVLQPTLLRRHIAVLQSAPSCPWADGVGDQPIGYSVTLTIESLRTDRARASYDIQCSGPGLRRRFARGKRVELRRTADGWQVVRILDDYVT